MGKPLDLDRGVILRTHKSGMKIGMYVDDPGTYLTENSDPVAPELAKQAGFDTRRDALEAVKIRKIEEYKSRLESEMATEEEALAMALSDGEKYDVRHVGGGQYAIFDAEGVRVVKNTLSKADVELIVGRKVEETKVEDE